MSAIATLLVSAAVSAIVGTFFAILTTSRMTVIRVRAERRESAHEAVRAIVGPWQRLVARYREGFATSARRDAVNRADDAVEAGNVLVAAEPLTSVRRALVRRRCSRVFGREFTRVARLHLGRPDAIGAATLLTENAVRRSRGREVLITYGDGLLQRGLQANPEDRIVRQLSRELWLLSHLL